MTKLKLFITVTQRYLCGVEDIIEALKVGVQIKELAETDFDLDTLLSWVGFEDFVVWERVADSLIINDYLDDTQERGEIDIEFLKKVIRWQEYIREKDFNISEQIEGFYSSTNDFVNSLGLENLILDLEGRENFNFVDGYVDFNGDDVSFITETLQKLFPMGEFHVQHLENIKGENDIQIINLKNKYA